MNAAEDFLLIILHTHVVASAKAVMNYNPMNSVYKIAEAILANFVHFPEWFSTSDTEPGEDLVHFYAAEVLTLSLVWHGFHDAIQEGDGERIIRYWKFLLIIFKTSNQHNYAKEAVNLLMQYHYLFTDRQKSELLSNWCINTMGQQGTNIPCDLHIKYLNRRLKIVLRNLGANINPKAVQKAGRSIGVVQRICETFEKQTSHYHTSGRHPTPKFGKDFCTILNLLEEENVFVPTCKRKHNSFDFKKGLMQRASKSTIIKKTLTKYSMFRLYHISQM